MVQMNQQTRTRYPRYDTFRGSSVLGPLILIGVGVFWLFVAGFGQEAFVGIWFIGFGVFNWFWSSRFAWRTWWQKRIRSRHLPEVHTEGDLHEQRIQLAMFHPYVFVHQTLFILILMYWAAEYPEFLSLHYGVWFCLSVVVFWSLLSFFFRYIGRGELRDFEYVHRFDAERGRFKSEEGE